MARLVGTKGYKNLAANGVYVAFGRGLNFAWFAFTFFWFWSNWGQIHAIYTSLGAAKWLAVWAAVWLATTMVLASWKWVQARLLSIRTTEGPVLTDRYIRVGIATAMALVAFVITALINPRSDIVYKAF